MDQQLFETPPAEFRPVAMWFLNGRLEAAELRRQIAEMARGGIGAIQVAARTGLETPYLSARWFELLDTIIEESRRQGMAVWLADEYPYPSGTSGGEVTLRHPEYRAWQMRATRVLARSGEEVRAEAPGTVALRSVAVPKDQLSGKLRWNEAISLDEHVGLWQREQVLFQPSSVYLTTRRYMSNGPVPTLAWRPPNSASEWEIWLIAAAEIANYKFFGAYVDLCNPDAAQLFLETTYERYLRRLGPERFARVAGFFLDESHPQNWSWCLPDRFRERNGYDLLDVLPSVWTDTGPETPRIRYDYWQTMTEMFVDSFHKPLAAWCKRRGVELSLEVPSTRNVVQRYADVPGIDPGHDKVGTPLDEILARELVSYRGNLTFPASLAAQTGRHRVLDELFHSVGWSLTLQDMKAMLDRAAARGANLFAFHAFCYTIGGLRKWDAPPSEFEQNPYWPHFSRLSTYAGRLAYAMSRGRRVANIAVLDPVSTLWTHQNAAGVRDEFARGVTAEWAAILRELTAAQRQHDTIDPLILAESDVSHGVIRVGDVSYELLVIPPIASLERAAWNKVEQFLDSGGWVVACGDLPREEIEVDGNIADRCDTILAENRRRFVQLSSPSELMPRLDEILPADLRVIPDGGVRVRRNFLVAQRSDGDEELFLIVNSSADEQACEIRLRGDDRHASVVTRLDLESGQREVLSSGREGEFGDVSVQLHFAPYAAELLVAHRQAADSARGPTADDEIETASAPLQVVDVDLDGQWSCKAADDNVLRLDRFTLTIGANHDNAVVVEPKPLINSFQDVVNGGGSWPGELAAQPIFGAPPRMQLELPTTAHYTARFDVLEMPARAKLCIEDLSLSGDWSISLNGAPVSHQAFTPKRRWDSGNREADVLDLLKVGENVLEVEIQATESWDGLLDAVYLLGDFGVYFGDGAHPIIRSAPRSLRWSQRHDSGFPYYAGTLHLTRSISVPQTNGPSHMRLPDADMMFAGVAELSANGHSLGVRAWAPYVWTLPTSTANEHVDLTLSIVNTLIEQLEGKRYDPTTRTSVRIVGQRA